MSEEKDVKNTEKQDNNETLLKTRSILISGEIDKKMAEKVVNQLLMLEAENDDPIKVFIDSPVEMWILLMQSST
jgi:ATP-dependent Clp protease protease subunit